MAKPKETFGQYLHRRRFEMGRAQNARLKQKDMAALLEQKLANPLIKITSTKLSSWECGVNSPRPEVEQAIRNVLGK